MKTILILCLCNNTFLECLRKWKLIDKYHIYRPKNFPDFCVLCLFFWCGMSEFITLNIEETLCFSLAFSVFIKSMAVCFLSLIINSIYYRILMIPISKQAQNEID